MVYPPMECARSLPPLTKKKEFRIINPEISFHKANRMYFEAVLDEVMPIAVKKIAADLFAFRESHPDKSMTFEAPFRRLPPRTQFHRKFFLSECKVNEKRFTHRFEANFERFRATQEAKTCPD